MKLLSASALVLSSTAFITAVSAAPIDPSYDTFGSLPEATFDGSGIPNYAVAIDSATGIKIGLSAAQRYAEPIVSNNGAGTFTAPVGAYAPGDDYARWNFNFYLNVPIGYTVEFLYDFDPGIDTDAAALGQIGFPSSGAVVQDSWNLGMNFLAAAAPGITPPSYLAFDPDAVGEYSFALIVRDGTTEVARSAINVNVSAPDGGTSLALLAIGLTGLLGARRYKK